MEESPSNAPTSLECGAALPPIWEPARERTRTLTGQFPAIVGFGEQLLLGSVEVAGGAAGVRGVVTPMADAFLVRGERIVTMPMAQDSVGVRLDCAPGEVVQMPAQAALAPCDTRVGQQAGQVDDSLPPGPYEVYARLVVNHDDGSLVELVGGPWALEVQ